jgi:hypothetical protein
MTTRLARSLHAPLLALLLIASVEVGAQSAVAASTPYVGVSFRDSVYKGGPQMIPGRLQNEYYDTMEIPDSAKTAGAEEGVTYHDTDNKNDGSGKLNTAGTFLDEFRKRESADLSYTKFGHTPDPIDDSRFNIVKPEPNSLYLGWIAPGEWVRYTVNVTRAGWYSITTAYTSKFGGHVSLDLNGKDATGPLAIPPTFAAADTIEWRQAHHWNRVAGLGRLHLPAGRQLLTLHFIDQPVMNFDWMEFVPVP